ncbi:Phosphatidate phosphatase APP1 [Klenkia marina]|uniref:Phosphatidate phosphatase APP1 n=1 Tax=Klenkia marina TaxID=1960309 RepID=A0A1G4XA33_9ACTN|nr:phosphatase domain-containing protein [Klenkia marina]SCX38089.1 Phosphatidate phosphatase APP1 [Klenkia marina]
MSVVGAAYRFETGLRDLASRVARAFGWTPVAIAYPGYGSGGRVRVLGRVLLAPAGTHPESRLRIPGWQRFLTLEAPRTEVVVEVAGTRRRLTSDDDGLLDAVLPAARPLEGRPTVSARMGTGLRWATAPVHLASSDAHRGVVCDIDDTVLVTDIAHPLRAAYRTFVQRSGSRRAVPGMADLLREVTAGAEHVPVLYLSNGPWNLLGPLSRFLERNGFPPGALLLTDWGLQPDRWFRDGQAHKRSSLLRLAEDLPGVDWTLVGDTGEHDPALYEEFARAHPDRVAEILLRDVTAAGPTVASVGDVPVVRAADGAALSRARASLRR